jgi:hypothetical protein
MESDNRQREVDDVIQMMAGGSLSRTLVLIAADGTVTQPRRCADTVVEFIPECRAKTTAPCGDRIHIPTSVRFLCSPPDPFSEGIDASAPFAPDHRSPQPAAVKYRLGSGLTAREPSGFEAVEKE